MINRPPERAQVATEKQALRAFRRLLTTRRSWARSMSSGNNVRPLASFRRAWRRWASGLCHVCRPIRSFADLAGNSTSQSRGLATQLGSAAPRTAWRLSLARTARCHARRHCWSHGHRHCCRRRQGRSLPPRGCRQGRLSRVVTAHGAAAPLLHLRPRWRHRRGSARALCSCRRNLCVP